jgi:hypothetical protein
MSYLEEKVEASTKKVEITAVEIRQADHVAPSVRTNFADKQRYFSV